MSARAETKSFPESGLPTSVLLAIAWAVVSAAGVLAARQLFPDLTDTETALVSLCLLSIGVVGLLTVRGWWSEVGFNTPAQWRNVHLLIVPTLIIFIPLAGGFERSDETAIWVLLLGYVLTGFAEEGFFRGVMLRVLTPIGPVRAAIVSAILFGLVHLGNILTRGEPAIVSAQAVGAACFGFGYAALRLRTNTIWPLVAIHALTDLFLQLGGLPLIPVAVGQDVILLGYGVLLLRGFGRHQGGE